KIERLIDFKAKGRCPPEDVGGPWGYAEFLEAIADPNHERHRELKEWFADDFNPHVLDVDWLAEDVAALAQRWSRHSRWSYIGINQQDFRDHGLRRPLLASDGQQWIGAARLQGGQQPRHHQHEFIWPWKIEECCERFDRSASLRNRKRQHAGGTTEPD